MKYINYRYNGVTETIDEFETYKEARAMILEYRLAYPIGSELWISQRCTNDWRDR